MKKTLLSFLLLIQTVFLLAQIPAGYYNTATGLTGTPLRAALHNIIDNHSVKSYGSLYTYYQTTDKKLSGKVWDMYSDVPNGIPPYDFNFSQTCGNYSKEGDCFNREHSWPQSWFNSNSPMVSDLFHVYPTDGKVNGIRSNYPYGEVNNPTTTTLNGSKLGPCSFPGYTGTVFEPLDEYKGDFARTYFYMCTRYYTEDSGWLTNDMIIGASLKPWALELMKKWNQQDPVSAKEIARNNAVYVIQGNRNPFIDHPEYACIIWPGGNFCTIIPTINLITRTPSIPTNIDSVLITATITDDGSISNAQLKWGLSSNTLNQSVPMILTSNNIFKISSKIPPQVNGTTIYYSVVATDNNANMSSSATNNYLIGTAASPSPVIASINKTPNAPTSADAVNINCTITDDGTVSQASLVWGTNGISFPNTINLNNTSGSNFLTTSSIPSHAAGTVISFKINATDNLGQLNTSSIQTYTVAAPNTSTCASDLIISEYFEGSSNNKYLEIFNGTTSTINLSDYKIQLFANGASAATQDIALSGTLSPNSVIVLKNSAATLFLGNATTNNATNFNGNDAVALFKVSNNSYVDILGKIGENPGTAWASGNTSMLDQTLVRKPSIINGISTNPAAGFPTLATEWDTYAKDDISHLGGHTMNCPTGNTNTIQTTINASNGFCVGSIINVNYEVTGSINQNNTFSLELSNELGIFNPATIIGTLTSNNLTGSISGILPKSLTVGNNYKVRVNSTDPQITGTSNTTGFNIFPLPNVNAGADFHICKGQGIVLNATGAGSFSWDNGAGDTASVMVNPSVTTTYEVIGINANGCSNFDSVTVYVDTIATPVIMILLNDSLFNSSYVEGNQWYKDYLPLQDEIDQTFKPYEYGTGIYFTIVTTNAGCVSDTSEKLNYVAQNIDFNKNYNLKVYPNPSTGLVSIQLDEVNNEIFEVRVYNTLGELVLEKTEQADSKIKGINLSPFINGIYIIEISSNDSIKRGILIKN